MGSEESLAAIALLDLSPDTYADAAQFARWSRDSGWYTYEGEGEDQVSTFHPTPVVAWEEWVADVDERGRGWSESGHRLFQLVAFLVVPERPVRLNGVFDYGSKPRVPGGYTVRRS